ncbi:MAG: toll/interleukin-1 receptor domain-containing protein [Lachnospiraceae bacterium]
MCSATLKVLEKRLEQSKGVIFVLSDNSMNSMWCKYELNYFEELERPIYFIKTEDIEKDNFMITPLIDKWYLDAEYKQLALLEGSKI